MEKSFVAFALSWVLVFLISVPGLAQTEDKSQALFNEAQRIQNQAQTNDDLRRAVEKYEQALTVFQQVGYQEGVAATCNNLGIIYKSWGQYDKAVEYYNKSLTIARRLNDPAGEASTLNNLGNVYKSWGQYDKAVEYYNKSLAISRRLNRPAGEASTLNNLGSVYYSSGEYDKAVEYYEKSLTIARRLNDPAGEANNLIGLGMVYNSWGQYDKAVEYYNKSLAISRRLNRPAGEALALNSLGNVYKSWGQYDRAMENFQTSLRISRALKDQSGESSTLSSMGATYAQMGQFEEALKHLQEADTINAEIGVSTRGSKDDIGNLYLDMGRFDKAEPLIVEAGYDLSLGRLHLLMAYSSQAADYYQKVRQRAEKNRDSDMLFASYTGLGMAFERLGDDKGAEDNYHKAVDLTEEVSSSLSRDQREKFIDVKVKGLLRTAPYDGLARVLLRMGKTQETGRGVGGSSKSQKKTR